MGPPRPTDEEAIAVREVPPTPSDSASPYRDDSSDSDSARPEAPLRRTSASAEGAAGRRTVKDRLSNLVPTPIQNAWRKTVAWTKGPDPPRTFHINPIFPKIQTAPIDLLDRFAPTRFQRFGLLVLLYAAWLAAFIVFLNKSSIAAQIPGYGDPVRLTCTSRYWDEYNGCGVNGDQCRPFANSTLAFRCPADCRSTLMLQPHAVGTQEVRYAPLVVGGPATSPTGYGSELVANAVYRGDSFICASAVHAGFFNDAEGGCGALSLTGEQPGFLASTRNGISSFGFDSYFPLTLGFLQGTRAECKDLRWPALVPSVFFTALLSLFITHPGVHFWSLFVMLFFHVALISDPPALTGSAADLFSTAFGRFLPAAFCAWITYRYAVRRTLTDLRAQVEKTVLWVGAAWIGALNNYTFDKIPIQRLTPADIKAQPGAVPALLAIIAVLLVAALGQAWCFRVEGRMTRYLRVYGLLAAGLLIFLAWPGLDLRIHHYILALLLLPGTALQTRPSLVYQGLLLGLFINGVARWGFASIVETPASLSQGIAEGTLLPTVAIAAVGAGARNITFAFGGLPRPDPAFPDRVYDGISVLVNDVERLHAYSDDATSWGNDPDVVDGDPVTTKGNFTWTWHRHVLGTDDDDEVLLEQAANGSLVNVTRKKMFPEYFRFAYLYGANTADYTKAGTWAVDGSWVPMAEGPSKS